MAATRKALRYVLIGLATLVVVVAVALVVLTRTDFGVERAGRFALDRLRGSINGELTVGRITSGGLLRGVTLHDVALTGPAGRPFVRADSVRLAYRLGRLVRGDIAFSRLIASGPQVYIEKLPGHDRWNYQEIFSAGDTAAPPDTARADTSGGRSLVLIDDITVHDGLVVVRMPWEPEPPVQPADTARLLLESVPGGLVRAMRFEGLEGRLPRVVWQTPEEPGRVLDVERLSTRAYIYKTPLDVERAEGTVSIRDSLVSFDAPTVVLPDSRLSLVGQIVMDSAGNRYDIQAEGDHVAVGDFRWVYPSLPAKGGGSLQFRLQTQPDGSTLWLARNADLEVEGSRLTGSVGVVTGDSLYFTNVALKASPLDTDLLRSLVPVDLPVDGLLIGTVEVDGPLSALRTRADLRLRNLAEGAPAESSVRWSGTLRTRRPYAVHGLEAEIRRLELAQLAALVPELRLRGVATGRIRADGTVREGLEVTGDVALDQDGVRSAIRGSGRFALGGDRSAFDLRFDAEPLALPLLTQQFPALGPLAGEARGPLTVRGSLGDLRVNGQLETPAGALNVDGELGLAGPEPRYAARGSVAGFRLDRLLPRLPETSLTGRFDLAGTGRELATMDGRLALDIDNAWVGGVEVYRGALRGAVAEGVARIDTFAVTSEVGDARARGTFGVAPGRTGALQVSLQADSLTFLEPVLLRGSVPADVGVATAPRLAGLVTAEGTLSGSTDRWSVRGSAEGRDLVYDDARLAAATADFAWAPDSMTVDGTLDSLTVAGRRVAHANGALRYASGPATGEAVVRARGVGAQALELDASFHRLADAADIRLGRLTVATRDGEWALVRPVALHAGRDGLRTDTLTLSRAPDDARIQLAGVLPWRAETPPDGADGAGGDRRSAEPAAPRRAALALDLDRVRIGELLRLAQTDTLVDGVATGRFRVTGTALAPVLEGRLMARPFRYATAVLDSAGGEVRYRSRLLSGQLAGWRDGEAILTGTAAVPVELALATRSDRLLDRPLQGNIRADSVPAGLVSFLVRGLSRVDGIVDGDLAVVGTPIAPELRGSFHLLDGTAVFEALNVRYRDMDVVARMGTGRRVDVDGRVRTENGSATVTGSLDLTHPGDPGFDLSVSANGLDATRRRDVVAVVDGTVQLAGRYTRPRISGDVRLRRGEMNLDEIWRQYQMVQLDTSLFRLFDTTTVSYRPPPKNPFLANLVLDDATFSVARDFWVRSQQLNVEVSGTIDVSLDRQLGDMRLTGAMTARRGTYDLQLAQGVPARRFDIQGGTIEFVGTPGIDPNLDISAAYRVRRAQGDPIDVVANVTGTLRDPRVNLTSDSDLPMSESDLASYILFGRSGAELTQAEMDVVSSGIGLARPVVAGLGSDVLQRVANSLGLPVDYVAFRSPESGWNGWQGLLRDTQVEVGLDVGRGIFVIGSYRLPSGTGQETAAMWRSFGARVELPFPSTWTTELYLEDRFARTPSFGLAEIDDRKVWGMSLFREWMY